jgi:hypothetical protein
MHRDTLRWILQAAIQDGGKGWEVVDLQCFDGWWATFPRIFGKCVKEGGCHCLEKESGGAVEGEDEVVDGGEAGGVATVANST